MDDLDDPTTLATVAAVVFGTTFVPLLKDQTGRDPTAGEAYTQQFVVSDTNQRRARENLRMEQGIFLSLCRTLRDREELHIYDTVHCSVEQQLFIFLYMVGQRAFNRNTQEMFQHSGEVISRYFHSILNALEKLSDEWIKLPPDDAEVPVQVRNSKKFFPYFQDCRGAADGTHIPAFVPESEAAAWRCRKGFLSQNVFAAVGFDFTFHFVLAGWEGSANDGIVLQDALSKGFGMPAEKYYLVDAGYGLTPNFLNPYRGVHYHLREWDVVGRRPNTAQELYNLRHSSLRNVVERIFGTLKQRFPILKVPIAYSIETQVQLVKALCGLHNYITRHGGEEWNEEEKEEKNHAVESEKTINNHIIAPSHAREAIKAAAKRKRDQIATDMWEDYCTYRRTQVN